MPDFNYQYLYFNDQPTTCPLCSARTNVIMDLSHTKEMTQLHKCLDPKCRYTFFVVVELDSEENPVYDQGYNDGGEVLE